MRIKNGFVLREVAGQAMVIATGEASKDFHGMIKLNDTGKDIWQGLMDGLSKEQIVEQIQAKYEVEQAQATNDVNAFVQKMKEMEFLLDD